MHVIYIITQLVKLTISKCSRQNLKQQCTNKKVAYCSWRHTVLMIMKTAALSKWRQAGDRGENNNIINAQNYASYKFMHVVHTYICMHKHTSYVHTYTCSIS